jgi:hypothetical protein
MEKDTSDYLAKLVGPFSTFCIERLMIEDKTLNNNNNFSILF